MQSVEIDGTLIKFEPVAREPVEVEVRLFDGDKIMVTDACKLLGVTRFAIQKWTDAGRMKKFKHGYRTLLLWSEVEAKMRAGYNANGRPHFAPPIKR